MGYKILIVLYCTITYWNCINLCLRSDWLYDNETLYGLTCKPCLHHNDKEKLINLVDDLTFKDTQHVNWYNLKTLRCNVRIETSWPIFKRTMLFQHPILPPILLLIFCYWSSSIQSTQSKNGCMDSTTPFKITSNFKGV